MNYENEVRQTGSVVEAPKGKGRKKLRNPETWKKNLKKRKLYSSKTLPSLPKCKHVSINNFKCNELTMQDIRKFHSLFYSHNDKQIQDNLILKYSKSESPNRKRARDVRKQETVVWTRYYIPKSTAGVKKLVQVCQDAFSSILGINKKRVQRVFKRHIETGGIAKENRGGDRKSEQYADMKNSVKKFVERLVPIESHYCRAVNVTKQYLATNLSIKSLWETYNSSCENEQYKVKYEYFREIFTKDYNISFLTPATDKCSKCLQYELRIKNKDDTCLFDYTLHKKRANAFFTLLKKDDEGVLTLSFDCQKNMTLPKVPDQAAYYCRQLYLYNFTICEGSSHSKQPPNKTLIYYWTEADSTKGSSQIASAVFHRLSNTDLQNYSVVKLFADGCGGQNKNSIMIFMLMHWLKSAPHIQEIQLIFPVPGHSYIPPDRVFGRIEQNLRNIETITKPETYVDVFKKHGTVFKLGSDCTIFDWKKVAHETLKKPGAWHFQFASSKRFILTHGKTPTSSILVRGEISYTHDTGMARKVCKPNVDIGSEIPLSRLGNKIKETKIKDVKKLLNLHFGNEWDNKPQLEFYKQVINFQHQQGEEHQSEDEQEGGIMDDLENIV